MAPSRLETTSILILLALTAALGNAAALLAEPFNPPIPPAGSKQPPAYCNSNGEICYGISLGISYPTFQTVLEQHGLYQYLQMTKSTNDSAFYSPRKKGLNFNGCPWNPIFEFRDDGHGSLYLSDIRVPIEDIYALERFLSKVTDKFGQPTSNEEELIGPMRPARLHFPSGYPVWYLGPKQEGQRRTSITVKDPLPGPENVYKYVVFDFGYL